MHKARVERLTKDLEKCTTQDLMGVAALLLQKDAQYARTLVGALADAVGVVESAHSRTYANVLAMLYGKKGVYLKQVGDKKILIIKAIRQSTGLGLKDAKHISDTAPKMLPPTIISLEEAVLAIQEAGGQAEIRECSDKTG